MYGVEGTGRVIVGYIGGIRRVVICGCDISGEILVGEIVSVGSILEVKLVKLMFNVGLEGVNGGDKWCMVAGFVFGNAKRMENKA